MTVAAFILIFLGGVFAGMAIGLAIRSQRQPAPRLAREKPTWLQPHHAERKPFLVDCPSDR